MPVRFVCPHCSRHLQVGRQKIGRTVRCPGCSNKVTVPELEGSTLQTPAHEPTSLAAPPPASPSASPEISVVPVVRPPKDRKAEPSIAPAPVAVGGRRSSNRQSNTTRKKPIHAISVSRWVIYLQGVLLVFVAIAAFILGVFFERASNGTRGAHLISPRSVTGRVAYRTELGALAGDSEAVVIVVPTDHRPDEKLDVAALRPEAPPPGETHPTIAKLRSIGGDFARAGPDGDFALEVPNAGKYFVLMISGHLPRSAGQQPTNQELAQIARYFVPADELLGMNAYRWSEELVRDNVKLSHTFE